MSKFSSNCSVSQFAIFRLPFFSYMQALKPVWSELKLLIKNASPDLFQLIDPMSYEEFEHANDRIKISVYKYFNRSRCRATPFGGFASFSPIYLQDADSQTELIVGQPIHKLYISWTNKDIALNKLKKQRHPRSYVSNPMLYVVENRIKYLYFENGRYELSSIDLTALVEDLVNFCKKIKSIAEIIDHMSEAYTIPAKETKTLLKRLVTEQILISSDCVNITGDDYFKRVGITETEKDVPYIITEREILNGSLNHGQFSVLGEAATFLNRNLPPDHNPDLESFKQRFKVRYEDKEVPLNNVLDPQIGIGYGDLAGMTQESQLIRSLKQRKPDQKNIHQFADSEFYDKIINGIIEQKDVHIDNVNVEPNSPPVLANTFSAIVENWGNILYVKHFGGSTGTALISRFSLSSSTILKEARKLAKYEANCNPEICFFDIAYQGEIKVDDINRRGHIYDYELSIATWNTADVPIRLEDILISVRNGEIFLRIAKSNKRLVPRITSAYNTMRADLTHFRFFADLQFEGIRGNLLFDIKNILKGLKQYPRVFYKNLLLSPAMYKVPSEFVTNTSMNHSQKQQSLSEWLKHIGLQYFRYGKGDQMLLFSRQNENDLSLFLSIYRVSISEYIMEASVDNKIQVKNELSEPFLPEFVITLRHPDNIYRSISHDNVITPKVFHPPGSNWLYFEIYCHPIDADRLLMEVFLNIIKVNRSIIYKWFFIRYNNPEFHLRIRVKTKDAFLLLNQFSRKLSPYIASGTIHNYLLKPYFPEVSRYSNELIEVVETFFYRDSLFVIHLVSKKADYIYRYILSARLLEETLISQQYSLEQRELFTRKISEVFSGEFKLKNDSFKIINNHYPKFAEKLDNKDFGMRLVPGMSVALSSFVKAIQLCKKTSSEQLIADLFHMHVNRTFSSEQRMHEMIIYVLYQKYLRYKQYTQSRKI